VAGEIHHIEVEVPAVVLRLADVHLGGPLAVRFSLPVLVATLIVHGELNAWIDGAAEDPDVFALMAKVRVKEDPKMTAWWPERMPARVRMGLVDGTQLVGSLDNPVGPRDNDEYVEAVRHKIVSLNMSTLLLDQLVGAVGATALSALKGTF
jgi:2-methylcitrate dehydratase PrpD